MQVSLSQSTSSNYSYALQAKPFGLPNDLWLTIMKDRLIAMGLEPFRDDRFEHVILGDVVHAYLRLDEDDIEIHRRELIRSCFSAIEGLFFLMKKSFLEHPDAEQLFSIHERAALLDESYQVKDNGKVASQTRYFPLPNMYKLLIGLAERVHRDYQNNTINSHSWDSFLKAVNVRHRLTHPKDLTDLQVSRKDANICLAACLRVVVLAVDTSALNRKWADNELSKLSPGIPNPLGQDIKNKN
jgi:hypothetical protein